MKRIAFTILMPLLLGACVNTEQQHQKQQIIDSLQHSIQSIRAESLDKDSIINQFFLILNEIEGNLTLIKEKERTISKDAFAPSELKDDVRVKINTDIQIINDLMVRNRQSVRQLNSLLQQSNLKIDEFTRKVETVTSMLEERDSVILDLKRNLADLDFSIQTLNATVDTLTREKELLQYEISMKTETLNTAWYAFGTRKELIENGVIEKAGGFLGIGKTYRIKSDFNELYFTRIDITQTNTIPLYAGKAQVITTHPSEAYSFYRNSDDVIERIDIIDINKFWSASRYLVVVVN